MHWPRLGYCFIISTSFYDKHMIFLQKAKFFEEKENNVVLIRSQYLCSLKTNEAN